MRSRDPPAEHFRTVDAAGAGTHGIKLGALVDGRVQVPGRLLAGDKPQRYIFSVEVVGGVSIAVCRRPRLPLDSRIGPHPNPLPEGEGEDVVPGTLKLGT